MSKEHHVLIMAAYLSLDAAQKHFDQITHMVKIKRIKLPPKVGGR